MAVYLGTNYQYQLLTAGQHIDTESLLHGAIHRDSVSTDGTRDNTGAGTGAASLYRYIRYTLSGADFR